MIRLRRLGLDAVFEALLDDWRAEYIKLLETNQEVPDNLANRYKHPELKAVLRHETCDKCAYCESKVSQVYPGDVEHIDPKARVPIRALDYHNLTYCCSVCNNAKRDYYDAGNPLLNPFQDDPPAHIVALGPVIFQRPGSDKGYLTYRRLDLNRTALVERRTERLRNIARLADAFHRTPAGPVRDLLEGELRSEAAICGEYTLTVRTYLQQVCGLDVM